MSATDLELLSQWVSNGDARAFNELVTKYSGYVYATCKRILGVDADAQEAAQECFIRLAETRPQIHTSLAAWLHTVATNTSLSRARSEGRRKERERVYAQQVANKSEPVWNDLQDYIDEAIEELPDELRIAILGCFIERKTHALLAEESGVDRSTVTRRIDRGVETIRETLRNRGITTTAAVFPGMLDANMAIPAPASLTASLGKIALSGGRISTPLSTGSNRSTHALARGTGGSSGALKIVSGVLVMGVALLAIGIGARTFRSNDVAPPETEVVDTAATTTDQLDGGETATAQVTDPEVLSNSEATMVTTIEPDTSELPSPAIVEATIAGKVYANKDDAPLPAVVVSAVTLGSPNAESIDVVTGSDGQYEFSNLPPAEYYISCELPDGFVGVVDGQHRRAITVTDDTHELADIDFALRQGGVLLGTVVTLGRPIKNALITFGTYATNGEVMNTVAVPGPVETDRRGRFRVEGLHEFDGMIIARRQRADGSRQEALNVVTSIRYDEETEETFDFVAGNSSLDGTVTYGAEQSPMLAEIQVFFTWMENGEYNEESFRIRTDETGGYFLGNLPAGHVKLHAWPTGANALGAQVVAFRLEESEHTTNDINFSEHVLNYHITNVPDWAVEVMIGVYPGEYDNPIRDMAGFTDARDSAVSGERLRSISSPNVSKELRGLAPGSYTIVITVWPVHYNMGAIREYGIDALFKRMAITRAYVTIAEGPLFDEIYFDLSETEDR